jgi:hypothetical protein
LVGLLIGVSVGMSVGGGWSINHVGCWSYSISHVDCCWCCCCDSCVCVC